MALRNTKTVETVESYGFHRIHKSLSHAGEKHQASSKQGLDPEMLSEVCKAGVAAGTQPALVAGRKIHLQRRVTSLGTKNGDKLVSIDSCSLPSPGSVLCVAAHHLINL